MPDEVQPSIVTFGDSYLVALIRLHVEGVEAGILDHQVADLRARTEHQRHRLAALSIDRDAVDDGVGGGVEDLARDGGRSHPGGGGGVMPSPNRMGDGDAPDGDALGPLHVDGGGERRAGWYPPGFWPLIFMCSREMSGSAQEVEHGSGRSVSWGSRGAGVDVGGEGPAVDGEAMVVLQRSCPFHAVAGLGSTRTVEFFHGGFVQEVPEGLTHVDGAFGRDGEAGTGAVRGRRRNLPPIHLAGCRVARRCSRWALPAAPTWWSGCCWWCLFVCCPRSSARTRSCSGGAAAARCSDEGDGGERGATSAGCDDVYRGRPWRSTLARTNS